MMKYLQSSLLDEKGLKHFDAWAANFAETVTDNQLSPEGTGYQLKTRFANFNNMPELMNMFKECADIKTADMLHLPTPECEMTTVVAKPTAIQKELIAHLGERAKLIRMRAVDPKDDNMPMITNDGRKIGLDQRLMNPDLPDEPDTKINLCVDNVFSIWNETSDDCSTQLIFSDLGVPQSSADEKKKGKRFSVYDDIKSKLILKGIPADQIAFIHDAKTETAKDRLFSDVRSGKIRILIGSTSKMGAGTNVQNKLIASHDLDAPWKPSDMEQRRGRMVRQGNENKHVKLFRYVTEGTFDAYLYQMLENKQKFISQVMTSKSPVRSCQDVDDVTLSFAEVKALSAGNPLIKEKMDLDIEVAKLRMLKANHQNDQFQLEDRVLKILPKQISVLNSRIAALKDDIKFISSLPVQYDKDKNKVFPGIILNNKEIYDKTEAGKALLEAVRDTALNDSSRFKEIGEYQGFTITAAFDVFSKVYVGEIKRCTSYRLEFGSSETGNITRLDNVISSIDKELVKSQHQFDNCMKQLDDAKAELGQEFPYEKELTDKTQRLEELTKLLDISAQEEIQEQTDSNDYFFEVSEAQLSSLQNAGIPCDAKAHNGKFLIKVDTVNREMAESIIKPSKHAMKM
ncbi:MAG: helicase-related protein [Oscillospiraceae bacterium]|nr:helicase-related protein [Oscillospiraceae bacterium]